MKRVIQWIGGEHAFALDIGGLRALQSACDAGPEQILLRIAAAQWRVDDLYQTIRLGLIGGGMEAARAAVTVETAFASHPTLKFKSIAHSIILQALMGAPDDALGEAKGETAPPESGGSASSTDLEQP